MSSFINASNSTESMRSINWDFAHSELEEVRLAMGLCALADVVRKSVSTVSSSALSLVDQKTTQGDRITLLDAYHTDTNQFSKAIVRFNNNDLLDADAAAKACGLPFEEFARRATRLFIDIEQDTPGFLNRAKATNAQEDLRGRKALWMTDIQPWGDVDNRDYGYPDDEDEE